jgi:ribosomal protein S6--L-glutamate ligase
MQCDILIEKGRNSVYFNGQSLKDFDVVIPRIGYTVTEYGAAVIRQFESMKVFTTLRSQALLKSRDKVSCLQLLSQQGVPVPPTVVSNGSYGNYGAFSMIRNFPKIIKLVSGTHGIGVLKADNDRTFNSLLETFQSLKQRALVQEFVEESAGIDVRAFIVDNRVVASMLRKADPGEFRSNLHRGGSAQKISLTEEEEHVALLAARIMGLKVAGVDMLRTSDGPLVLEVNASPGLEGIETTTKVDVAKYIIDFVERSFRKLK